MNIETIAFSTFLKPWCLLYPTSSTVTNTDGLVWPGAQVSLSSADFS